MEMTALPTARLPESEKITINLGYVDLGQIDLLVHDGFYSNRTDFIRSAIRNQLDKQGDVVRHAVGRRALDLGLRIVTKRELEAAQASGNRITINVLGLVRIALDVSPALALDTIDSISVLGSLHASPEVRLALRDRIF